MRILYCHNQYKIRSGEDIAHDWACDLLRESGHDIVPFGPSNAEIDGYAWQDKALFPARVIHATGRQQELATVIATARPDVAIVQNVFPLLSPAIYYALAKAQTPTLQLVYNYRMFCLNGQFFTQGKVCERCLTGSFVNGIVRRCFQRSFALSAIYATSLEVHRIRKTWQRCIDLFVTPDDFLKRKLMQGGLPEERIRVLCNPMRIQEAEPDYHHEQYGLFVGRLIRPKGIFTLLEAAMLTAGRVRLLVVGEGEDELEARSHPAVVQKRVELLGPVYGSEFDQLLRGAAFVVVPSEWYDNLPMIVCQAFNAGKPVLASRINGIPEYVDHGRNGLLFTPGNASELAAGMVRLLEDQDLQGRLARQARRTAAADFAPEVWRRRFEGILTDLLKPQERRP